MARLGTWSKALKGFYDKDDPQASNDLVARLLFSARGIILVISAQAAIIAGLLSYLSGAFNPFYFVLTLVGFVAIHAVSNLTNDYVGYVKGHDTPDSPRRRYTLHPLADGILTKNQMKVTVSTLLTLVATIAGYLTLQRGVLIIPLMAIGAVMLFLYDAAPRPLKEVGLGEAAAFVVWGPLMIWGGDFVISGRLSLAALLFSVPYGLGVMSILLGKHIDQQDYDAPRGINTLPVLTGERGARMITVVSILLMYVFAFFPVAYGRIPVVGLVSLLNVGAASAAVKALGSERPKEPPKGYVGWPLWYHRWCLLHSRRFGWLYVSGFIIAIAISAFTPFSQLVSL